MRNKPLTQYKTTTYKQPTNTKNPSLLHRDLYRVSQNYHDSSGVAHPALNDGNASYFGETVPPVGNRDQWKNNGSAGLNGNAIESYE
jgi:hypothetical protein